MVRECTSLQCGQGLNPSPGIINVPDLMCGFFSRFSDVSPAIKTITMGGVTLSSNLLMNLFI